MPASQRCAPGSTRPLLGSTICRFGKMRPMASHPRAAHEVRLTPRPDLQCEALRPVWLQLADCHLPPALGEVWTGVGPRDAGWLALAPTLL